MKSLYYNFIFEYSNYYMKKKKGIINDTGTVNIILKQIMWSVD